MGTLRDHIKTRIKSLYLNCSFNTKEAIRNEIEKSFGLTYDEMIITEIDDNKKEIIFDFGDVQMSFILTFALHESGREVECVHFADVDVTPTIFEKIKGVKPHIEKKLQVKKKIETYKRWVLIKID